MGPSVSQIDDKFGKAIAIFLGVSIALALALALALMICYSVLPFNCTSPYIEDLYVPSLVVVPALNKPTTFNSSVFVDLKIKRKAAWTCHGFPKFQMRLKYSPYRNKSLQVGAQEVQGFNMGRHTRVHVKVAVEDVKMPWEEASRAVSSGKEVMMEVQLKMPEEDPSWVASVAVDASGHMVSKKPIKFEEADGFCLG